MSKITLTHLAKKLKISVATVSKAINGYADVNIETKKKVLNLAKSLNFTPNAQAAFLRTKKTKVIGVIIPHISHPFFSNIVKGILNSADKNGYLVILLRSNESYVHEKKLVERLLKHNVDGIFISLAHDTYDLSHLEEVKKSGAVLIQFDKISKILNSSKVVIDDRRAGYIATEHLIKNGCKNIVHFRGPLLAQISIDRFLGYKKAIEEYNLTFDKNKVILFDHLTDQEGYRKMNEFISKKINFDGLFSISDYAATGAIECLKKNNFHVPNDVKVIGFSNWILTDKLTPSLTTIDHPGVLMGKTCFNLFLNEITSKAKKVKFKYEKKTFTPKLIIRESSVLNYQV
ncbi:MAG: LacI family DNA-binding transcriptional regulator [Flavobacteriaceae bacterium]|nr:LacI family DNA-binding transcriptional regulator [Flavobacteriaceae bacterium]